ncbi:MAG: hypothetical protein HQM16_09000 [Deltaproteobacteria bacterium]|nr:hypothetical protein [Deltaproteobacteria bacterium]
MKRTPYRLIILLLSLAVILFPATIIAQADEGTEVANDTPDEGFTGTYSDEDPESPAYEEKEIFGEDEADTTEETEDSKTPAEEEGVPTHLLKFEFESQVTITNTITEISYIEINYTTKLEKEIEVKNSRFRTTGKAEIMTDIVGDLAGNELFSCTLDIQMDNVDVDIMVKLNSTVENEEEKAEARAEEAVASELALQFKFPPENLLEGWLSNCTAVDGSLFNTAGEKEKYLIQILESIDPPLTGMISEDYNPLESATIDLTSETTVIEDVDAFEKFTLEGKGKVTVEPIAK